jgi:hypothetical protein
MRISGELLSVKGVFDGSPCPQDTPGLSSGEPSSF